MIVRCKGNKSINRGLSIFILMIIMRASFVILSLYTYVCVASQFSVKILDIVSQHVAQIPDTEIAWIHEMPMPVHFRVNTASENEQCRVLSIYALSETSISGISTETSALSIEISMLNEMTVYEFGVDDLIGNPEHSAFVKVLNFDSHILAGMYFFGASIQCLDGVPKAYFDLGSPIHLIGMSSEPVIVLPRIYLRHLVDSDDEARQTRIAFRKAAWDIYGNRRLVHLIDADDYGANCCDMDDPADICPICQSDLVPSAEDLESARTDEERASLKTLSMTPCGHVYHRDCQDRYAIHGNGQTQCAVCRGHLDGFTYALLHEGNTNYPRFESVETVEVASDGERNRQSRFPRAQTIEQIVPLRMSMNAELEQRAGPLKRVYLKLRKWWHRARNFVSKHFGSFAKLPVNA